MASSGVVHLLVALIMPVAWGVHLPEAVPSLPHQQTHQRALAAQGFSINPALICYGQCLQYARGNCTDNCANTPIVTTLPPDSPQYPAAVGSIKQVCYSQCVLEHINNCAAGCNYTAINATLHFNLTRPTSFTLPPTPNISVPLPPSSQLLNSTQLQQCYDMLILSVTQYTQRCQGLPPWDDLSLTPVWQPILARDFCEVTVPSLYDLSGRLGRSEQ